MTILNGLLQYRAALHSAGLTQGFQWLDGSFMEHVELFEGRPLNDIDVATFFRLPGGMTQRALLQQAPNAFDRSLIKQSYRVDAYVHSLGGPVTRLIPWIIYWYSFWSHRRNMLWKGYLQVDLSPIEDEAALALLASLSPGGPQP